ncbi:MAG: glycosyltransferase family 2 protein [Pseudomonadota bacterium]
MAEQDTDETENVRLPDWFDEIRPGGEMRGFFDRRLRHSLVFVERPVKRLLVSFDNLSNVNDESIARVPWAYKFARDINISHLGVMAHVADWYRDEDLIQYFEKLTSEGFFEGYDRVIFAGVSMGGFAAVSFASLVPGAHVVSINPQSTLDIDLVPWETRYANGRRQDWTLPYSDASKLTQSLGRVSIFYDPYFELDKKHVERFTGKNVRIFNCRYSNHKTAVFLRKIGALKPIMRSAIFDEITENDFYKLYRARRDLPWFRGAVAQYFVDSDRNEIAERFAIAFRKRLRQNARQAANSAPDEEKIEETREQDGLQIDQVEDPVVEKEDIDEVSEALADASEQVKSEPKKRIIPNFSEELVKSPRLLGERGGSRLALVTTMKNEGPFMLEWVAYHRAIGFTDFLIYTNDCDDGTDKIAMRLEELGLAVHRDNRFKKGASPQRVALRRALREEIYQSSDWIMCSDCDEFVNVRAGDGTMPALLDAVGEADAISLCWKLFGCGDQVTYQDRFVHEHFTWSAPEDFRSKYRALGLKTLFRPSKVIRKFGVHRPKFFNDYPREFVWKDAGGQLMPESYFVQGWTAHKDFSHKHARLHHYAVRSVDSFLVKRDRGRTNHIDRDQGVSYWADMNLNTAKDDALVSNADRTRVVFDSILEDKELSRLHEDACKWHQTKVETLKSNSEWAGFFDLLQAINRPGEEPVSHDQLQQKLAAE